MSATLDSGDQQWSEAGDEIVEHLARDVQKRAKAIRGDIDVDAVHDMRTATRRLRTAIKLYASEARDDRRKSIEKELKRVARRLGSVRDLDVLLEALDEAEPRIDGRFGLSALRSIWQDERKGNAHRLVCELEKRRFRSCIRQAKSLVHAGDGAPSTIATRAPALIWDRFGDLVAFDIDPATADPDRIHEVRIAAKKLRYTLEAFEDALAPGATLINEVTAFQDAAGDMHDAIVAGERARGVLGDDSLRRRDRSAIAAFADAQARHAEGMRPRIVKTLRLVRSRSFRQRLATAVAEMGHVSG